MDILNKIALKRQRKDYFLRKINKIQRFFKKNIDFILILILILWIIL